MNMGESRWPGGRRAAISITLDNMGEAADLYRGTWPAEAEIGCHYSVVESLPRILDLLAESGVRATYFIEGWNAGVYGEAIHSLHDAGHEIACHGWQHEPWTQLDPDTERELLRRSIDGFEKHSLRLSGFRPPGGVLTKSTPAILRELGFTYCSPAGRAPAIDENVAYLPFDWQGIDAYYYSEGFAGLRKIKEDPEPPVPPEIFAERVESIIEDRVDSGGYTALLFHPFLEIQEDRIGAMQQIVERVMRDDRIWCAPGYEVAYWIDEHRSDFGDDPILDTTSWSR